MGDALAFFITFHTYGTWLHGRDDGSVDRDHRAFGTPLAPADPERAEKMRRRLRHPPLHLSDPARRLVCDTVRGVCGHRGWTLHALHVRTNHVHAVVAAPGHPKERVLADLKAWSTRRLREAGVITRDRDAWAEHGSTRPVWNETQLAERIDYTLNQQGHVLPGTRWPE